MLICYARHTFAHVTQTLAYPTLPTLLHYHCHTLHYITLHCITLDYITLDYNTRFTLHYIT